VVVVVVTREVEVLQGTEKIQRPPLFTERHVLGGAGD
jgi:hypothetical protein